MALVKEIKENENNSDIKGIFIILMEWQYQSYVVANCFQSFSQCVIALNSLIRD